MGAESDTRAWSAYSGAWRPIEVRYSSRWPIGWGRSPFAVLASGLGIALVGGFLLYVLGSGVTDAVSSGDDALVAAAILAAPGLVFAAGVASIVFALSDVGSTVERTGPILRLRMFGDDDSRRYYVAVDDGTSSRIRAWPIGAALYGGLAQGELVTASVTRKLGHVRSIVPVPGTPPPSAGSPAGDLRPEV
jgi:hypothetical protein